MARLSSFLVLLGICVGCSKPSKPEPAPGATREIVPLSKRPLPVPDGSFSGEVEAAGELVVEQNELLTSFSIPLDASKERLQCTVYPANPMQSNVSGGLGAVIDGLGSVGTVRQADLLEVLVEEDQPLIFMELVLSPPLGLGGNREGKLMMYLHPQKMLFCALSGAGDAESFKRITLGLARSLRRPPSAVEVLPTPHYVELQLHRLDGRLVGFEKSSVEKAPTGRRLVETLNVALVPLQREISVWEKFTSEGIDEHGIVGVKEYHWHQNGREIVTGSVKRVGGTEYTFETTRVDQKRTGKLTSKRGLSSAVAAAGPLRDQLLSGKVGELRFDHFNPAMPGSILESVWTSRGKPGRREAELTMEGMKMAATLDENGLVEKAEMSLSGKLFTQERVYKRGDP